VRRVREDIERRVRDLLVELRVLPATEMGDENDVSPDPHSGEN
jgi:hypothetical protein